MSGPQASRNPFMPPPNTLTVSASAWTRQNISFNVLFNIMDQGREESDQQQQLLPNFQQLDLWSLPEQVWPSTFPGSTSTTSTFNHHSPDINPAQDPQIDNNVDQFLNSISLVLSALSSIHPECQLAACGMCLENYLPNDQVVVLPCHPSHYFHKNCIRNWFQVYLNCPLCRRTFNQP